jgi:hypothetical protein
LLTIIYNEKTKARKPKRENLSNLPTAHRGR